MYVNDYMSMVELIVEYGAHLDSSTLNEMTDILAFERALANVCKFNFHLKLM